ncbi:MAG: protein kinase [Elusimicrobia bacterium]|nr:protein kinase [Elusimicrobiota bacterium]
MDKAFQGRMTEQGIKQEDERNIEHEPTVGPNELSFEPISLTDKNRYEILKFLKKGGMGKVYKARDRKINKIVALKRLLKDAEGKEKGLSRFLRESQAIASLNHSNIVDISNIGRDEDGHFIVMEYVEGENLFDKISKEGKLNINEAIGFAMQIGKALSYAHRKGVIHRDIKPSNILITKEGVPKIVDFGLAQTERESGLSQTGYGMGTVDYMPPEQGRDAKNVDHRADIYAFGATFYEMVTGEKPKKIYESKIPEELRAIIFKATEDKPEDRYFSVDDLLRDLEGVRVGKVPKLEHASKEGSCHNCGFINLLDVKYCKECGAGLFEKCPNSNCGYEDKVGTKFCGKCGLNIEQFKQIQDHLITAKDHYSSYNYSRAIKELEKALQFDSNFKEAVNLKKEVERKYQALNHLKANVQSLFKEEKYEDAENILKQSLELSPRDENSVKMLNEIPIRVKERDIKSYLQGVKEAFENKNFKLASMECLKILNIDEANEEASNFLAESNEKMIQEMFVDVDKLNSNYQWGEALHLISRIEELAPGNLLVKSHKEEIEAKLSRIQNLLKEAKQYFVAGKYKQALENCRIILGINPHHEDALELSEKAERYISKSKEHLDRGRELYNKFEFEAAINEWSKLEKLKLINDEIASFIKEAQAKINILNQHIKQAKDAFSAHKFEQVILECKEALRIKPTDNNAVSLSESARNILNKIAQLKKNAKTHIGNRQYKAGINCLCKALKYNSTEPEAMRMISEVKTTVRKIRKRMFRVVVVSFTSMVFTFLIIFFTFTAIKNRVDIHAIKKYIGRQEYKIALKK